MSPITKKLRFTENIDYISILPHDVISDILSRLPTNEAVRTSILSRTWKTKWTSIYNVDMDERLECFSREDATASFSDVVTRVLLGTRNSRLVSFRLFCDREGYFSKFDKWISNVFMRRVQHVVITARMIKPDSMWCFTGWGLVTELRLEMSCTLRIPGDNCFSNLKKFRLCGGAHGNLKIETTKCPGSDGVVLVFPVLVVFQLSFCEWLDSVEIQAPELLCFTSLCSRTIKNYEIKICAPKLAIFELRGRGPVNNYVLSAPAVTYAALSNWLSSETSALQAHKILTKFSNLKCLRIHGEALLALLSLKPRYVFPSFGRLTELEVKFNCPIKDVLDLLQVLPPLESLIISVKTWEVYEFGEALTPKIVSQLKEVKLLHFSATKGQYDLAMCLLEKALNLEKMTVYLQENALNLEKMDVRDGNPIDMVEAIRQSLSNLKPESARCELVVEGKGVRSTWAGSTPSVIMGIGNKHQIVY